MNAHSVDVSPDEGDVNDRESGERAWLDLAHVAVDHRDREGRRKPVGRDLRYRSDPTEDDRRFRRLDRNVRLEGGRRQPEWLNVVDGDVVQNVESSRIDRNGAGSSHVKIKSP